MKKHLLFLAFVLITISATHSQTRGVKIGYIDMEYILQNVPNYIEANNQLEQKAQKWKIEIEAKKTEINKLKEALKIEKALLTKGLIDERESEIKFLEKELLDLQQNRFGPNGNLMNQKSDLAKPIQDQVFAAIQDIAEAKKYDFIFDKASDLTMLFAAKRYDISDQVLRIITRSDKREQLTKKQLKLEEEKDKKEDEVNDNPAIADRQKALDERKAAREKMLEDRKLAVEEKKREAEEKRAKLIEERDAKKSGTTARPVVTQEKPINDVEARKQEQADAKAKIIEDRKKAYEDRKREAEEKRAKALEERESKINAPKTTPVTPETSKPKSTEVKTNDVEARKQEQADAKAKIIEDRKKAIEDRRLEVEAKKAKALEEKENKKTGTISANPPTETAKQSSIKTEPKVEPVIKDAPTLKEEQEAKRAQIIEERKKALEERKKIIEDKRLKAIQVRDSIIKSRENK